MQAVCSQFASGSGAGDQEFKDIYMHLDRDSSLFKWPFVFEEAAGADQNSEEDAVNSAQAAAQAAAASPPLAVAPAAAAAAPAAGAAAPAAAASPTAAAAARAEEDARIETEVNALSGAGASLRAIAQRPSSDESRGGYIGDQDQRGQVGADLSQRLSSTPARFEGVAIYPPLPGCRTLSGDNPCDSYQSCGAGSVADPGGGTDSYFRFNVGVHILPSSASHLNFCACLCRESCCPRCWHRPRP